MRSSAFFFFAAFAAALSAASTAMRLMRSASRSSIAFCDTQTQTHTQDVHKLCEHLGNQQVSCLM